MAQLSKLTGHRERLIPTANCVASNSLDRSPYQSSESAVAESIVQLPPDRTGSSDNVQLAHLSRISTGNH
jgi:hypothetical protein